MDEKNAPIKENISSKVEPICNNLISDENLALKAFAKCINKTTSPQEKKDACLLQNMIYQCAMRKQFLTK